MISEQFQGWRTAIANILMAIIPILDIIEAENVIPENWMGFYATAVVLVNLFFRTITTTKPGWKK